MGLLDETGLEQLVGAGCRACGSTKLVFHTYVDGVIPFMAAEPVGRVTWIYDGEKFVDGVYAVACAACGKRAFEADLCPRCHAPGGLARALDTPNGWPVPAGCADESCGGEEIRYFGFLPARVAYEGRRAERAKSSTEPHESGFHGYLAVCRVCQQTIAELTESCPLCGGPGPLRVRPG
jgi:RNA polymerase subunit RPABC4/transcription elongation factor Spt4